MKIVKFMGKPVILNFLYFFLIAIFVFSACQPVEPAAAEEEFFFEQGGIKLHYDPQLVIDVQPPSESVPASGGDEAYSAPHPEFVHFDLYMEQAQVYVAPVEGYKDAADFAPGVIADLQALIDTPENFNECVPELPLKQFFHTCDHQQFNASLGKLDFQNGSGIRFVTVYAVQDMAPVDNDHLLYVFQGFTNDGKYYLKALVRMLHAQLPDTGEIPADIYSSTDPAVLEDYFGGFERVLEADEAGFAPKLKWIDAFLGSLRVE